MNTRWNKTRKNRQHELLRDLFSKIEQEYAMDKTVQPSYSFIDLFYANLLANHSSQNASDSACYCTGTMWHHTTAKTQSFELINDNDTGLNTLATELAKMFNSEEKAQLLSVLEQPTKSATLRLTRA